MAVSDTDLLLVQRGNQPYKADASEISSYVRNQIDVSSPSGDIPVASASQLGVIRVGANLDIDGNGILSAVIPAGLSYKGHGVMLLTLLLIWLMVISGSGMVLMQP